MVKLLQLYRMHENIPFLYQLGIFPSATNHTLLFRDQATALEGKGRSCRFFFLIILIESQLFIIWLLSSIHSSQSTPKCMLLYQSFRVTGILKETSNLHSYVSLLLRYLRMINKELDKIENTSGRRNTLQLKDEDLQHWDNVRRKLNLRTDIEEVRVKFWTGNLCGCFIWKQFSQVHSVVWS